MFWQFFNPILHSQGHILSTGGDVSLIASPERALDSAWKCFSHPKFKLSTLFSSHSLKPKQGLHICGGLLIANHLIKNSQSSSSQYSLASKFKVIYFIFKPLFKTETGTAYTWGTTNSKPPNQKQPGAAAVNTLCADTLLCCNLVPGTRKTVQFCWATTNFLNQTSVFWLFFIQFQGLG
jgi:hypothetical protein